ncbi:unnamed protein product [Paramecium primaurelia]|uniref:Uncharacterized protein n=1 Tax=Paramecium primaurelia TaxID=5886 RepID=A0A8S1KF19_PARPR|nr:unnamed protein product [Paramecium primaurelia]
MQDSKQQSGDLQKQQNSGDFKKQQNSGDLSKQQNSGEVEFIGQNSEKQLITRSQQNSKQNSENFPQNKHVSDQSKSYKLMDLEVSIKSKQQLQEEDETALKNFIKNYQYHSNYTIGAFLSNLNTHLQSNEKIQDYNVVIQTNHLNDFEPDTNTQLKDLTKSKIKQYFANKDNVFESPKIKEFLKQQFEDIFPNKKVAQMDFISLTINLVLFEEGHNA